MSDTIDKVHDLIKKVYVELQETRSELQETRSELHETRGELHETRGELHETRGELHETNIIVNSNSKRLMRVENQILKMEHGIKEDIRALYDGYKLTYEKLQEHDIRFDLVDGKIDDLHSDVDLLKNKSRKHSYEIGALKRKEKSKKM